MSNTRSISVFQVKDVANTPYAFRTYDNDRFNIYDYEYAGRIEAEEDTIDNMLERAYDLGNSGKLEKAHEKARSVSVSDLLELDGRLYYVDNSGFTDIALRSEDK